MEFHIARTVRERVRLDDQLFSFTGNVVFANVAASRKLAERLNELEESTIPGKIFNAGAIFAMGLIDELSHALIAKYRQNIDPSVLLEGLRFLDAQVGPIEREKLLLTFTDRFPNVAIFRKQLTAEQWLSGATEDLSNRQAALEEMILLWLANQNPAFAPFGILFGDRELKQQSAYTTATSKLPSYFETRPPVDSGLGTLLDALRAPMLASPDSLTGQLDFIRDHWSPVLGEDLSRVLLAIDVLREEEIAIWMRFHPSGNGPLGNHDSKRSTEGFDGDEFIGFDGEFDGEFIKLPDGTRRRRYATDYQAPLNEYEAFSADQAWMPTVVLMAKNTYVWLEQLSKKYGRHIHSLGQIPDEELQTMAARGITGLWLIGLWERSAASRIIKRLRGNSDAVASAYSLKDYRIAEDLGGESAYADLRDRAAKAGLRLASDMVPNHMGLDSNWVIEHPDWFLSRRESPFPSYRFEGPDVSTDPRVEIKIEDHYYDNTDAAVVYRLHHHRDGATRYVYHGNDGTTFAWNDTAQIDYSKAEVRESIIQVILDVARRFPIIRFDAAMVLAKRHVQRLWFPLPGAGGAIPSRAENAMSEEAFDALMPHEFWREVVDRVAVEVPGTLLLAEAFWLLESYFVRTLGMHRVYNSAFMNMLRDEENAKYRSYLKKTVEFDPDILKRYVNFMSNPDERTAIDQFGSGDKYFGVSVLLATLPGLPMFGHGQIEGFTERYGMDFKQARVDEYPNEDLIARHQHLIAPLLKKRHLFAESEHFFLYDFWNQSGTVDENVFAYSNRRDGERAIILYNNSYESTRGTIHSSVGFLEKASGSLRQQSLAYGLDLPQDDSTVIAYFDSVVGLEYLRRAKDFRDQGLTVDLRGYQHMALLNWRELVSTAAHPWDRLCDALNGSGVYSVEEALSKLQIRPLLEALRQAVTASNIGVFVELAGELESPLKKAPDKATLLESPVAATKKKLPEKQALIETLKPESSNNAAVTFDPRLKDFIEYAGLFKQRLTEISNAEDGISNDAADSSEATNEKDNQQDAAPEEEAVIAAALHLPMQVAAFPEALQIAAATALPSADQSISPAQTWAPVLAWLVFQMLPPRFSALSVFEKLNLRWALAETFSSVGLEGEAAWKAAAQISVLLKFSFTDASARVIESREFWEDQDVRWLAGIHTSSGVEYINRERFEALLCWLDLPALLNASVLKTADLLGETVSSTAITLNKILEQSAYEYHSFLEHLERTWNNRETSLPSDATSTELVKQAAPNRSRLPEEFSSNNVTVINID